MLVTHSDDHITHAIIGGKKQINFGISDDPAFFQILSSALYKDPMLAMVRETICNAWDAHIESGRTTQPISITLDDDYLIIRDHGNGIPDSMIGPIYGVYGASTKKNDGRQTGGFGLGCKSPFAYTDHFEVTSCHNGVKTIYNMSKSSAQVQGKPSIVPIASFPTTESGISVKIPLNPEKQNQRLNVLIRQVVFNGDIIAMFNGSLLPILGLGTSECGLVLINDKGSSEIRMDHFNKGRIYIRYGNVIYPVEKASEYAALYDKVHNVLDRYYSCKLVMLAEPDSISITPSREALTLSDITVISIQKLLGKFLAVFFKNQELMVRHKELAEQYVDEAAKQSLPVHSKVFFKEWSIPGIPEFSECKILNSTDHFAFLEMLLRYGGRRGSLKPKIWFKYVIRYLWKMQENGEIQKGLLQKWMRTAQKNLKWMSSPNTCGYNYDKEMQIATRWWRENVLASLIQDFKISIPEFNKSNLYFASPNAYAKNYYDGEIIPISNANVKSHTQNLIHLMNPTIIVTHNAKKVTGRMRNSFRNPVTGTGTITRGTFFVLEVTKKGNVAKETIEKLKTIPNLEVIDLTIRLPYEEMAYLERQAKIAKTRADAAAGKSVHVPLVKKARPGLVQFDFILDKNNKRIDTKILSDSTDPIRITKPEFVVLVSTGKDARHVARHLSAKVTYAAAMLYGSVGAVTNKEDAYERYRENGAMEISDYLFDKINHDIVNLPTMLEYHSMDPEKIMDYIDEKVGWSERKQLKEAIQMLLDNPELLHLIPDFKPLSDEDQCRWTLWRAFDEICTYKRTKEIEETRIKVKAIPLKQEIKDFLDKMIANPFLGLINAEETSSLLREYRSDQPKIAKIKSFIEAIIS